jgi:hypothetical protein
MPSLLLKFLSAGRRLGSFDLLPRCKPPTTNIAVRCLSTTYYYDSQSGLNVPVHNEREIKLFLSTRRPQRLQPFFVPHQLYKNQNGESDDVADQLRALLRMGIRGVILPPLLFPRDVRNLKTLTAAVAPAVTTPDFTFLYSHSGSSPTTASLGSHLVEITASAAAKTKKGRASDDPTPTLSLVVEYEDDGGERDGTQMRESLRRARDDGIHTTLRIAAGTADASGADFEPIALANSVGSLIDATEGGCCDLIWISSSPSSDDDDGGGSSSFNDSIVPVCEELIYLDVAGPTIKSRLLVDAAGLDEDVLGDVMFAGVNKYVIDDDCQVEMIEMVAADQGKSIVR